MPARHLSRFNWAAAGIDAIIYLATSRLDVIKLPRGQDTGPAKRTKGQPGGPVSVVGSGFSCWPPNVTNSVALEAGPTMAAWNRLPEVLSPRRILPAEP